MKKRIYINESMADLIKDISSPIDTFPNDIKSVLKNHKTSLGINPAFPPEEENSFDYSIANIRFKEVRSEVSKLELDDYSINGLSKVLQKYMQKCKDIENPNRDKLEKLCYNKIIEMFLVPEGFVNFKCNLVDSVDDSKAKIGIEPTKTRFKSISHMKGLSDDVYKRRLINAIITGAAMRLSDLDSKLIGEIYQINSELPSLYKSISAINNYMLFLKNNMGITDKKKKQAGISYLTLGNDVNKSIVVAEGEIFPILLHESIKGFMELFSSYGLPDNKQDAKYVMDKADFLIAEPWDMRLGPALWDLIYNNLPNKELKYIPGIITELFSLPVNDFNEVMQEILGNTEEGENYLHKITNEIVDNYDREEFNQLMIKKNLDKSLINDSEFFNEEDFDIKTENNIK